MSYFREFYDYLNLKEKNNYNYNYLLSYSLFALSDSYIKVRQLDSASFYAQKGIELSLQSKDSLTYPIFLTTEGMNQYYRTNYKNASDSLQKGKMFLAKNKNDKYNYLVCLLYLGKNYYDSGNKEKAIPYFISTDSIFKEVKVVFPEIREAYELLIDYYKNKENQEQQLYYMNRLIYIDSLLRINHSYLFNGISKKYDLPELLEDKENLIDSLNQKEKYSFFKINILSLSVLLLLAILSFYYKRHKQYRSNLNKLLQEYKKPKIKESKVIPSTELPQTVIDELLLKLEQFEKELGFLSNDCTINLVAKNLETNSSYLSKVINSQKDCNFSTYINELRVDYAIDKLKNDHQFRLFTINAIATEVGFNNSESFSKAFYKKTGIYPSYFISELKK